MNLRQLKLEFFYIRKAFLQYHQGWRYVWNKWVEVPRILKRTLDPPSPFLGVHWTPVGDRPLTKGGTIRDFGLSIHILSCKRDLTILCWALKSFYRVWDGGGDLYIHSDGSLGDRERSILSRLFPWAQTVEPDDAHAHLEAACHQWPQLVSYVNQHAQFVFLKKLIDPFVISQRHYRLVMDSDVLWFRRPDVLIDSLGDGVETPFMMRNNRPTFVSFIDGTRLSEPRALLNSGIVLYRDDQFDGEALGSYLKRIDTRDVHNLHFIEQAGYATCLKGVVALSEHEYVIADPVSNQVVAKHYTSVRRPLFYVEGISRLNV